MIDAFGGYTEYATRVIEDRRGCPRDDLMSVLVHAEVDGERLDDGSLLFDSLLILIGGDETTRHVISGGAYQLLSDRAHWDTLLADRSLVTPAVEEMLRWVSPIKNMARTATRTTDFHGTEIREGDQLLLLYPSANRDENHFDDPFRFDITRTPNDHVAFGFGPHFCLGSSLARIEARVMFEQLLERLARSPARRFRGTRVPARELRQRLRVDARRVHAHRTPRRRRRPSHPRRACLACSRGCCNGTCRNRLSPGRRTSSTFRRTPASCRTSRRPR